MRFQPFQPKVTDPTTAVYLERGQEQVDPHMPFAASALGEIPVVAVVTDLDAWSEHSAVTVGTSTKKHDEQKWIVTARVPVESLPNLEALEFVERLQAARPVSPTLHKTIEDFEYTEIGDPNTIAQGGEGVIVGIIDSGCDFAHEHFRSGDDSRILAFWDQGGDPRVSNPDNYPYGTFYSNEELSAALASSSPYDTLGYKPNIRAHGTHVMGIAAGNDLGNVGPGGKQFRGVAPKSQIVFVNISSLRPKTISDVLEKDFGDSVRLIEALKWIFEVADKEGKPCVVNISLGTHGGPHDGTNPAEMAIDSLVKEKPNRAVVISAGNSHKRESHKTGELSQGGKHTIGWNIKPKDKSYNEIEIWYPGSDEYKFSLTNPQGTKVAKVGLGASGIIRANNGYDSLVYIIHRQDPGNHDNVIHIFQQPQHDMNGGKWTIGLTGETITGPTSRYHAWVERDNQSIKHEFYRSTLNSPDTSHTLGSLACGRYSFAVGSYDAAKSNKTISFFSAEGPTRDGRQHKPEVSAPGHGVLAAASLTSDRVIDMSGTSMAAPAVTGLIALIFGLAQQRERSLTIDEVRTILFVTARRDRQAGNWDARYGFGRVTAAALNHGLLAPPQPVAAIAADNHEEEKASAALTPNSDAS